METGEEEKKESVSGLLNQPGKILKKFGVDLAGGELMSIDFFTRHWKATIFILAMLLLYIGKKYDCTRKMAEIRRVRAEIVELKNEAITLSSELTGIGQPSQIEQMLKEKGIEIAPAKTPSYKLIRKKYEE